MTDIKTVTVKLGDEDVVLTPSSAAAAAVSRQFGGVSAAFDRIARIEIDAMTFVIAAGTGKHDAKSLKEIGSKVFDAGLVSLISPLSEFVGLLMSGGRATVDAT